MASALSFEQSMDGLAADIELHAGRFDGYCQQLVAYVIANFSGVLQASVWMFDAPGQHALRRVVQIHRDSGVDPSAAVIEAADFPMYFAALRLCRVIDAREVISDPRANELYQGYLLPNGITALLDVPIRHGDRNIGVLCLEYPQGNTYTEDAVQAALSLAEQLSAAYSQQINKPDPGKPRAVDSYYHTLLESLSDAVFILVGDMLVDCNEMAAELFCANNREQMIGLSPVDLSPATQYDGRSSVTRAREYLRIAKSGERTSFEWLHKRMDGTLFDAEVTLSGICIDAEVQVMAIVKDISDDKRKNEHIYNLANTCSITGMMNRRRFVELMNAEYRAYSLFLIDIGSFKEINEVFGPASGDRFLHYIGLEIKKTCAGLAVTLARIGTKQFAILCHREVLQKAASLSGLADKLHSRLSRPYIEQGIELPIEPYVVCIDSHEGENFERLWQYLSVTLDEAKQKNCPIMHFEDNFAEKAKLRTLLLTELESALLEKQLYLVYQPKLDLRQQRITGVEALIRWDHPSMGMVSPADFIPLAEKTSVINTLTRWVINECCAQASYWLKQGHQLEVAINLSARNLLDNNLPGYISDCLERYQLPERLLCVELTESALMSEPERALPNLHAIAANGIRIAIDDYGTGYSSLSYLHKLPIDELKIDRSFIDGLLYCESSQVIVPSTIQMAHKLNLSVVAEGIEEQQIIDLLCAMGCDCVQGYHISRPLPRQQVIKFLQRFESRGGSEHWRPSRMSGS